MPGTYTILTSSGITGTFDSVTFTGATPNYSLSYLPIGNPTFVQFDFLGYPSILPPSSIQGQQIENRFLLQAELVNVISWTAPTSGNQPVYYQVYRNDLDTLIGVVYADQPLIFEDHNRLPNVMYTYYVVSVDIAHNVSAPISITIAN